MQHKSDFNDTIETFRIEEWSEQDVRELREDYFSQGKVNPMFEGEEYALYR